MMSVDDDKDDNDLPSDSQPDEKDELLSDESLDELLDEVAGGFPDPAIDPQVAREGLGEIERRRRQRNGPQPPDLKNVE